MTIKETSRKLLFDGYTKKVECTNYWDSHGNRVEYAPTHYTFDSLKKWELFEITQLWVSEFPDIPDNEFTHLVLLVEGKPLSDLGEIAKFRELKTKLKLDCCVGWG